MGRCGAGSFTNERNPAPSSRKVYRPVNSPFGALEDEFTPMTARNFLDSGSLQGPFNRREAVSSRPDYHISQFWTVAMIGQGGYAVVRVVQHKTTRLVYAIKQIAKSDIISSSHLRMTMTETEILLACRKLAHNSPPAAQPRRSSTTKHRNIRNVVRTHGASYFPKFFGVWQDQYFIYILMEYLPGGDLMKHLIDREIFPESHARIYTAQLVGDFSKSIIH